MTTASLRNKIFLTFLGKVFFFFFTFYSLKKYFRKLRFGIFSEIEVEALCATYLLLISVRKRLCFLNSAASYLCQWPYGKDHNLFWPILLDQSRYRSETALNSGLHKLLKNVGGMMAITLILWERLVKISPDYRKC